MPYIRPENQAYHYTYQITCSSTKRVFYGLRSCDTLLDEGFNGKGQALSISKKEHGIENHVLERIAVHLTRDEAKEAYADLKASELVNPKRPGEYAFHYVYMILRTDGKYYVGVHSTNNINDKYMGSGSYILKSIKKHGKAVHSREIVQMCTSRVNAFDVEREILTDKVLADPLCMNLGSGGEGGAHRVYGVTEETRKKMSTHSKTVVRTPEWCAKIGKAHKGKVVPEAQRRAHSERMSGIKWKPEDVAARTAGQLSSEKFKERYRHFIIDGITYQNGREAVAALNIPGSTLHYRLISPNWVEYRYADSPVKLAVQGKLYTRRIRKSTSL